MKKILTFIVALTCVFSLTACGKEEVTDYSSYQQSAYVALSVVQNYAAYLGDGVDSMVEYYDTANEYEVNAIGNAMAENYGLYMGGDTLIAGISSYVNADKEVGGILSTDEDYTNYSVTVANGAYTVAIDGVGTNRNCTVQVTFEEDYTITGIVCNPNYTFGEKMAKAGLNTLLGMGTVFCVLIFISFIIRLFGFIPKIQAKLAEKDKADDIKTQAADKTIAQIQEREEEELSDDLELVAVISAAIAAYEGSGSADGFVVRSIRRSGRRF